MSLAMSEKPNEPGVVLTEEQKRRRRARSIALAVSLGVLVLLAPVGALPWLFGYAGLFYGVTAIAGGVLMIAFAWRLCQIPAERTAKQLFAFSILYLFMLFSILLVEHSAGGSGFGLPFGRVFA